MIRLIYYFKVLLISLFEIINVAVHQPRMISLDFIYTADAVNPNDNKTLFDNGLSTFSVNGKSTINQSINH